MPEMSPEAIASAMDGRLRQPARGRFEALLPSPCVQNHAAFLSVTQQELHCLWFGGSLEGKSDISIWRSTFEGDAWGPAGRLTDDPDRSEQNPVEFLAPDGRTLLLHTAQPGGNQDACVVRIREIGGAPRDLTLPPGTFIRAPIRIRSDGAWLMGLFRCASPPGQRWTGSHDTAALAISGDAGATWREVDVPGSEGCVHMTPVETGPDTSPLSSVGARPTSSIEAKALTAVKAGPRRSQRTSPTTTPRSRSSGSPMAALPWRATRRTRPPIPRPAARRSMTNWAMAKTAPRHRRVQPDLGCPPCAARAVPVRGRRQKLPETDRGRGWGRHLPHQQLCGRDQQ